MLIKHHFSDGLYAKEVYFGRDHRDNKHVHDYSHLSILARGTAVVSIDGVRYQYTGPCCIEIKKGKQHSIETLTDDVVWYCIHATDCTDVSQIDEVLIAQD